MDCMNGISHPYAHECERWVVLEEQHAHPDVVQWVLRSPQIFRGAWLLKREPRYALVTFRYPMFYFTKLLFMKEVYERLRRIALREMTALAMGADIAEEVIAFYPPMTVAEVLWVHHKHVGTGGENTMCQPSLFESVLFPSVLDTYLSARAWHVTIGVKRKHV